MLGHVKESVCPWTPTRTCRRPILTRLRVKLSVRDGITRYGLTRAYT